MRRITLSIVALAMSVGMVTASAQTSSAYSDQWYADKAKSLCGKGYIAAGAGRGSMENTGTVWAGHYLLKNTKTKQLCSVGFGGKWGESGKTLDHKLVVRDSISGQLIGQKRNAGNFSKYAGPLKVSYTGKNLANVSVKQITKVSNSDGKGKLVLRQSGK